MCRRRFFQSFRFCPRPIEYNTKAQIRSSPVRKEWLFRLWNGRACDFGRFTPTVIPTDGVTFAAPKIVDFSDKHKLRIPQGCAELPLNTRCVPTFAESPHRRVCGILFRGSKIIIVAAAISIISSAKQTAQMRMRRELFFCCMGGLLSCGRSFQPGFTAIIT